MKYSVCGVYVAAVLATTVACSDSSQPSSPSGLTASVAAPRPMAPANSVTIKNGDQPATLVVQNAVATQSGATTYTFEVASDPAFAAKVLVKDGIAEGSGGQTTVRLDTLTPNRDYYWHARATAGGTTGLFGTVYKFTIGPAITIDPPIPVGPLSGTTTQGWPTFVITNSTRTTGTGSVAYLFEVSTTPNFSSIIASAMVGEQANRTSFTPTVGQPAAQTPLYWRATAIDQTNNISSPSSAVQSITFGRATRQAELAAQAGYVLWPGAQPPGTNGHAAMGPNWEVATLVSFDGVRHVKPALDELQIFDLMDRGMNPDAAIAWMNSNGYGTVAVYYASVQVIGFPFEYLALVNGAWEIVIRVGA
ncbi:MAG TPA: hypothetical protein VF219_05595 [Vicinamibacterales bacterium]